MKNITDEILVKMAELLDEKLEDFEDGPNVEGLPWENVEESKDYDGSDPRTIWYVGPDGEVFSGREDEEGEYECAYCMPYDTEEEARAAAASHKDYFCDNCEKPFSNADSECPFCGDKGSEQGADDGQFRTASRKILFRWAESFKK